MNTRRCLKIASRISTQLERELGTGVDPLRMLAEPLYARDVLLVCEAQPDTELAQMAAQFRQALIAATVDKADGRGMSGFSPSRFLNSLLGAASTASPASTLDGTRPARARGWLSRLRQGGK